MGALRWILLLAGLLFLAGLFAWESRRARRLSSAAGLRPERSEPPMGSLAPFAEAAGEAAGALAPSPRGDGPHAFPELGDVHLASTPPPRVSLPELDVAAAGADIVATGMRRAPALDLDEPLSPAAPPGSALALAEPPATRAAVVDWPPESERHILALRIVAVNPERLSGRVLRQALGACGFEHGRFGIFHQPGADGRALLSAANLAKPGIFDPVNMDFQRFSGLSLFAVLPGPLPPAAALDHLLDTAQDLAERLCARVQDEQGVALGAEQLEAMRRTVQGLGATAPAEPTA